MTREEAIKELKSIKENIFWGDEYGVCFRDEWVEAYEMAISALREQPRWISVEERLPEDDVLVLCIGKKGGMFLGYPRMLHVDGSAYTYVPNARGSRYATHWMPLPSKPEEVE